MRNFKHLRKPNPLTLLMGLFMGAAWILDLMRTDQIVREETREAVHDELYPDDSKEDEEES